MSLAGKLEDVPLADVMQFIHLGRRTGTLNVDHQDGEAKIHFHNGAIVGARSPSSRRLGELLTGEGVLTQEALDRALAYQVEKEPHKSLGQVLLASGEVEMEQVRGAIRSQIERTIYEVVTWHSGSFVFELDTLQPIDDIAVFPGDLIPDFDLNTQMVLLEAARIFDERARDQELGLSGSEPALPVREITTTVDRVEAAAELFDETHPNPALSIQFPELEAVKRDEESALASLGKTAAPQEAVANAVLQLVSAGSGLLEELGPRLIELEAHVENVAPSEAGQHSDRGRQLIVAFELAPGTTTLEQLAEVCRRRPGLPVICILHDVGQTAKAYAAGAAAVVPPDPAIIVGCFRSMARFRRLVPQRGEPRGATKSAFDKLRRVVADLRSGVFSATVALNLMNVISESVERAVLFLVKRSTLSTLGAFGFDADGRPLAECTRGLEIQLGEDNGLHRAIEAGRALSLPFREANFPAELVDLIGPPAHDEAVVFPVLGSDRVILVVYTDNGPLERPIEEIDVLDLAAAEVGIAFENELLRRQLSQRDA